MERDNIDPPDAAEAHRLLTDEIAALKQQLTTALASAESSTTELSELRMQLETAQRELTELRTPPPAPAPLPRGTRLDGFYPVETDE